VMEGEAANGKIEGTISRGKLFGVGGSEADIGQPSILTSALGNPERCHGQVDPDHFAASRRQRHRDVTRSGRDFDCALTAFRSNGGDQSREAIFVGDYAALA